MGFFAPPRAGLAEAVEQQDIIFCEGQNSKRNRSGKKKERCYENN
jgi:hypothetical protein